MKSVAGIAAVLLLMPTPGFAQIVPAAGSSTIALPQGQQIQIRGGIGAGANLFHSFDRFNLDANQTATFFANPAIQNILGRVVSGEASRINGLLQVSGNANLILMNPAGILFGATARLDVPGSFTATTANRIGVGSGVFNAVGTNDYARLIGTPSSFDGISGGIFNAGNLTAGQNLSLFGGTVLNTGTLNGQTVSIAAVPNGIRVTPEGSLLSLELPNSGDIATRSLPELLTGGELQNATQAVVQDGIPTLTQAGTAIVSGTISGSNVQIVGDRIGLIDATVQGESIRVGGDRQGMGEFPRSQFLFGNSGTQIEGRNVILWSDQATRFHGSITANNGFVETSGKQTLDVSQARISAVGGTWLLDPSDITIVSGGTGTLTSGVFDPPNAGALIDPATIEAALNNNTSVTLTTANGSGGSGDITLLSSITQTGSQASLTLTARQFFRENNAQINLSGNNFLVFNLNQVAPLPSLSAQSIQTAIDAIGTGSGPVDINLGTGTYTIAGTPLTVSTNRNLTINGNGSANTTLTGNSSMRVVEVSPGARVTLSNLTIADGSTPFGLLGGGSGGGIFNQGNTVLNRVVMANNTATGTGGGIRNFGTLTINDSTFNNNSAGFAGGGIRNSTVLSVNRTIFNNGSSNYGGAISNLQDGTLTLFQGVFNNNTANIYGGAIANDGAISIIQTEFAGNRAITGVGGAVSNTGTLTMTGGNFINNATGSNPGNAGGAIASFRDLNPVPQVTIMDANFAQNASYQGGAIRVSPESRLSVQNTRFFQNQAFTLGGAIDTAGTTEISGTLFQENSAFGSPNPGGGAIYTSGSSSVLNISTSHFLGNRSQTGGAIDSFLPNTITIDRTLIEQNVADGEGGAILSDRGSALTITNSEIRNNRSTGDAGALYISANSRIENTIIQNNVSASGNGGGIYTIGNVSLINSRLIGNTAVNGGGLFIDPGSVGDAGTATITGTTIADNLSTANGGGIANTGQLGTTNTTFSNNTAIQGGGLFSTATSNLSNTTLSGNTGGGIFVSNGVTELQSTTIANNTDGIFNFAGTVRLSNTIIANSLNSDVFGLFDDLGNNLIGISDGSTGFTASTLVGTRSTPISANLAPLANNGGLTSTHVLLPNSPAINRGGNLNISSKLDQAGRPRIQDTTVDIGAFESTPIPTPPDPTPPTIPPTPFIESPLIEPPIESPPIEPSIESPMIEPPTSAAPESRTEPQRSVSTVIELERSLSNEYAQYYGFELPKAATMQDIQDTLARAQQSKGVRSGIIYALFVPNAITPAPKSGEVLTDGIEPITPLLRSQLKQQNDRLELILVTPTGRAIRYSTTATRAQVAQQAKLFRLAVSDVEDEGYLALSKQLYQWLVQPLERELQSEGIQGLIYCLDEGLRTAPIAAMADDRGFVVDRYAISMIPSVTLLNREIHTLTAQSVLAMGADYFREHTPLPAVPTELELISEQFWKGNRFLNQDFTLERLLQERQRTQAGIVHLATHAEFNPGTPERSYIQLWDRSIKLSEMSSIAWSNPALHLLVLSACDTAIDSVDAELGFTGLAAASGVHSVMGSLWEVSDVGTLALMSEFYIQLQKVSTRAEALRRAQLALRNGTVRIENGSLVTSTIRVPLPPALQQNLEPRSFEHPFYWSAFTLVGNSW
ncbi:CHAT domain-containing protein [Leptolyngbya sp. AN03gr2]|uniref:CHAT domain-containing protein n=1 Tax=unclassified Leptolyngbya TaxID=2650499 RepID=UPI003D322575